MIISPLLALSLIMKVVAVLFVLCSIVLMLVVLIQKGKGGGLNAALGGSMASSVLGSKTGDFLTWVTIAAVGIFLGLAVVMAKFYKPSPSGFNAEQTSNQLSKTTSPQPAATDANKPRTADVNETAKTAKSADVKKSDDANLPGS